MLFLGIKFNHLLASEGGSGKKLNSRKKGTVRKSFFAKGEWRDMLLYSILREEWKAPKIQTKTVPQK